MVKQIILPILGVIAFITVIGLYYQNGSKISLPAASKNNQNLSQNKSIAISDKTIKVEIANTPETRTKGLSGRSSLEANSGMLFVFDPTKSNPTFWMKDMLIPLDFIWISRGKVIKIDENIQPPKQGTPDSQLETFTAGQPVDYMLEVNGGFVKTNNIHVGDNVNLSKAI